MNSIRHFRWTAKVSRAWLVVIAITMIAVVACGSSEEPTATPRPRATQPASATAAPTSTPTATAVSVSDSGPKQGGIVRHGNRANVKFTDPMWDIGITVGQWGRSMWPNNIVRRDPVDVTVVIPNLAESWDMEDGGKSWVFHFRSGMKWHDGTPFSAEDVKFWMNLHTNPPEGRRPSRRAASLGSIESIDVIDPLTLRVNLTSPTPRYLNSLSDPLLALAQPRHLYEPEIAAGNVDVEPKDVGFVGLGGFKMKEYEFPTYIDLERVDDYWKPDLPLLDGARFILFADSALHYAAFRTGRLDASSAGGGFVLSPAQKETLVKDLGDTVWFEEYPDSGGGAHINTLREGPWSDVRVRQAVNLWIDRQAAAVTLEGGDGLIGGFLPPTLPISNPDILEQPGVRADKTADRAEAKRLLAEAGFPDGFKTKILTRDRWSAQGEFLAEQLRTLGIDAELDVVDNTERVDRIISGDYEVHIGSSFGVFPEQGAAWFSSDDPTAPAKHNDPKVGEFLDLLQNTVDQAEYVKIAREMEQYVVFDKVYILMYRWGVSRVAYRDYVKGVQLTPLWTHHNNDLDTWWLDK
jgi:peptide/nickel transport system substrate-binding protein